MAETLGGEDHVADRDVLNELSNRVYDLRASEEELQGLHFLRFKMQRALTSASKRNRVVFRRRREKRRQIVCIEMK